LSLRDKQDEFLELIESQINGEPVSPKLFDPPPRGKWLSRFELYSNGLRARTKESMEVMYPRLVKELGDEAWTALGSNYLASGLLWPRNLNDLGLALPEFMGSNGLKEYLIDLARFERALHLSFHAFDSNDELSLEDFQVIDEESRFEFRTSMHLIKSNWNLFSQLENSAAEWICKSEFILIYRLNFDVKYRALTQDEYNLLTCLKAGASLGEALEDAQKLDPERLSAILAEIYAFQLATKIAAA